MAFSTQNGMSSPRGRRGGMRSMAEINIVPLVDVVLVLLVIFMLTAHVMEFGLEIEVPKVKQVRDSAQELPVISITRAGEEPAFNFTPPDTAGYTVKTANLASTVDTVRRRRRATTWSTSRRLVPCSTPSSTVSSTRRESSTMWGRAASPRCRRAGVSLET